MDKTAAKAKKPVKAKAAKQKPGLKIAAVTKQAVLKTLPSGTPKERQRFTLYGSTSSGPSYTAALGLALSGHPFSYIHVNLRDGAHKQPDYLVKNRFGQVPALRDGQMMVVQSAAILMHISEVLDKFNSKVPLERQRIREWLFWQWDKLAIPVYRLRAHMRGTRQLGSEIRVMYDTEARAAIALLEQELSHSQWIVGKRPTIADIGIYGVLRYAPEASIELSHYPNVMKWKKQFEQLPGFAPPEALLPMESRLI